LSPNEFLLEGTYFSNPFEFIDSASTNLDEEVLKSKNITPMEQKLHLETTKSTIARRLMKMLQEEGDEDAYYDSVKCFQLQHATSQISSIDLKFLKNRLKFHNMLILRIARSIWWCEREVLRLAGFVNGWGISAVRPLVIAIVMFAVFGFFYNFLPTSLSSVSPWQRSYDIAIVAGYSLYGDENIFCAKVVQNLQIFVSIIIYTIFFSTVVNRLSRVR